MTKRVKSKYKINRRLGVNLWGRPKSPVNTRDYRPGQHGHCVGRNLLGSEEYFACGPRAGH